MWPPGKRRRSVLTLGELEALACFGLAGLFTFYGARVAGHEAVFAEYGLVVGVDFDESASYAKTKGFGLSFVATAVEVDVNVVFVGNFEGCEGLLNDILKNRRREVHFDGALVDGDNAGTFFNYNAGYGGFTAAYCIYCFHTIDYFRVLMSITVGF